MSPPAFGQGCMSGAAQVCQHALDDLARNDLVKPCNDAYVAGATGFLPLLYSGANLLPLKDKGLPETALTPRSPKVQASAINELLCFMRGRKISGNVPVQRQRKFSTVLGTTSPKSSSTMRPSCLLWSSICFQKRSRGVNGFCMLSF